jgi:hypothetical protein
MATGAFFTNPAVSVVKALYAKMQTSARIGLNGQTSLNAAVDIGGGVMTHVGVQGGAESWNAGELSSVGFSNVPTYEDAPSVNVAKSALSGTTELAVTATLGLQQVDPRILAIASGNGIYYAAGDEAFILGGLSCVSNTAPIELSAINQACDKPTSPVDILVGLTSIVTTIFDSRNTAGLDFGDLSRAAFMAAETTWEGQPIDSLPDTANYWSMYFF